jgi:deoxyribodipyrimidine photolyase
MSHGVDGFGTLSFLSNALFIGASEREVVRKHNKSFELTREGLAALRSELWWRAAQFQR